MVDGWMGIPGALLYDAMFSAWFDDGMLWMEWNGIEG